MARDAQGHTLSRADTTAARHIDDAVRAFALNYGDPAAHLNAALEQAPHCTMADLMKLWLQVLSNEPTQVAKVRAALAALPEDDLDPREASHLAALRLAAAGRWPSAVAALDRHLMHYPHDLAAHQCAMRFDGYLGRFHRIAGRSAQALPSWSKDMPGHGIMLSFYGFGLEELGDYARAEDIGRASAELEPFGYWSHHTVSHVLEMTGRPDEGVAWMNDRQPYWSDTKCSNRAHIWWHKALFHIELGDVDTALQLYDDEILPAMRPIGNQLCNPTALLWRLETLGCDAGDRWQPQHAIWQQLSAGRSSPFISIHAAMTALRAGERAVFETHLRGIRDAAAEGGELAPAYRDVALPIVEAMAAFVEERYADAVDRLLPVRADLWRMGGSTAQRDLVEWTLTEAAIRAGQRDVALSLSNERLALRPDSAVNQRFQDAAQAIAA